MLNHRRSTAALGAVACLAAAAAIAVVTTSTPAAAAVTSAKVPDEGCCGQVALTPGQHLQRGSLDAYQLLSLGLPPAAPAGATVYGQTYLPYELVLQSDGNLVEYQRRSGAGQVAVWTTHTTTGNQLIFQRDHNVVLYDAAGRPLWSSGTAGTTAAYFGPYGNGQVVTQDAGGRVLAATGTAATPAPGVMVDGATSPGRSYALDVQSDGNLVEYDIRDHAHERAVWSTRTAGAGAVRLAAQPDGNLVLYQVSTGRAVWNSHTHGPTAYYQLDVQDDANVVLYRTDGVHRLQAVWASGIPR